MLNTECLFSSGNEVFTKIYKKRWCVIVFIEFSVIQSRSLSIGAPNVIVQSPLRHPEVPVLL